VRERARLPRFILLSRITASAWRASQSGPPRQHNTVTKQPSLRTVASTSHHHHSCVTPLLVETNRQPQLPRQIHPSQLESSKCLPQFQAPKNQTASSSSTSPDDTRVSKPVSRTIARAPPAQSPRRTSEADKSNPFPMTAKSEGRDSSPLGGSGTSGASKGD
jgi:hypothetical protein